MKARVSSFGLGDGVDRDTEPAIAMMDVGKRYRQLRDDTTKRRWPLSLRRTTSCDLWALRGVNLHIGAGETVGLIGRNGAGKSSLLRLLAGVAQPTEGCVELRGRVAPLLAVGVGFHPEMSGRENVFVNAMLLGLSRAEIERRFDDIVDFAELRSFIDTPVKFFSSGMFMRLGFSVAVHVEPQILLIDEVIAVGDAGFQLRCLERMRELHTQGTTIVFVSHNMHAVHLLCPRTIVMHQGHVAFDGSTDAAIGKYHQLVSTVETPAVAQAVEVLDRVLLSEGRPADTTGQGEWLTYRTRVRLNVPVANPSFRFRVLDEDAILAYALETPVRDRWRSFSSGDEVTIEVGFRANLGGGGTYRIGVELIDEDRNEVLADADGPLFYVPPLLGVSGPANLEATIAIDGEVRKHHRWSRLGGEEVLDPRLEPGEAGGSADVVR